MTLAGLLRQTLMVESVSWSGITPTYAMAVAVPSRVEEQTSTVTTPTGDSINITAVAYLPPGTIISRDSRVTLADGSQPIVARIQNEIGGDGKTHHIVVSLATAGSDTLAISRQVFNEGVVDGAWDATTGVVTEAVATAIWTGTGMVRLSDNRQDVDVAGANTVIETDAVLIPVHTPAILVGDMVTVTATDDPMLIGLTLRVLAVSHGSDQLLRKIKCVRTLP